MLAHLHSFTLVGIEALPCEVEVNVGSMGFAEAQIVGLPDAGIKESRERIRTAIYNCGYQPPAHRTLINLAPADLRKEGPALDLPIALGQIFCANNAIPDRAAQYMIAGELALDGRVRPIKGVLSMAILAKDNGMAGILAPRDNANEAAVVDGIDVIPVASLTEAVGFLTEELDIEPAACDFDATFTQASKYDVDFSDVRGQEFSKRALTVAAAGGHNILMLGPPGSGKTLMAKCLPTILPPLTLDESLETTRIWSASGKLPPGSSLLATRPVRSPHHSASGPALVGGGSVPQAGEVSLAHHGVLFLDEFPEFQRTILETLRQPLEDGRVTIARSHSSVCFPAEFMLVAAMNPCPCGYFSDPRTPCKCSQPQIERYFNRISGPLIDRIDIHVSVQAVPFSDLRTQKPGTTSETMREQVVTARHIQKERFGPSTNTLNGRMGPRQVRQCCPLDTAGEQMLKQAMTELGLSARAHDKVLRLSRTIADLDGAKQIDAKHLAEAIQYRKLDRRV